MSSIVIKLDDTQIALLKRKALEMNVETVEALLLKIADSIVKSSEADFDQVMRRVLDKNHKLYMRLA
jgi:hypothetical protein